METLPLSKLIEKSLVEAYSYQEYKNLVSELLAQNESTAKIQTPILTEYSKLNERRMKRWDKTLKLSSDQIKKIENYSEEVYWLVISEGWCGDAAHALPVLNKLAELNDNIDLKIVLQDSHDELMNQFLTNGGKSIPKLIIYKPETKTVIGNWGPRPSTATKMVEAYKKEYGTITPEFKEELQRWYNKDKGQTIVKDIIALLEK
ncbi:thioredoxin family protein [Mesonia aquimarina]|uniref:thioredoxin family protein n=1 Tax=Mesonia aquimarina TaxID=1504967 RepID=UPI000EF5805B|nr:thioredoxin family protein [Mesonia aquimarina]